jgi:hypothetical protein
VACLTSALLATVSARGPQKKFMGGPVTIEDQGSFAAIPFAPPGQPPAAATPQQITIESVSR